MLLDEIRKSRKAKGLTQARLGELVGVSQKAIARLESGVGSMNLMLRAMVETECRIAGLARGRTFLEQLRHRRGNLDWSISEAADRSGLSRATISALERGEGTVASLMRYWAVIGGEARTRKLDRSHWQQAQVVDRDSRLTPPEFLDIIHQAFGEIDLDPCAHRNDFVQARRKIIREEGGDGLTEPWNAELVWCNPPFSQMLKWLRKADEEWSAGRAKTIVCLVPARSDSSFYHDRLIEVADIGLLRGRLRFHTSETVLPPAPFGLMLAVFGARPDQLGRVSELTECTWPNFGLSVRSGSRDREGDILTGIKR